MLVCFICGTILSFHVGRSESLYQPYFRETAWDHEKYFGSIPRSMLSLVQVLTRDNWQKGIVSHVAEVQPHFLCIFMLVILVGLFGMFNVIVGITVAQSVCNAEKDIGLVRARKEKDLKKVVSTLRQFFEDADVDGSGTLSLDEVTAAMENQDLRNILAGEFQD
jgi:hypothetical protein